VIRIWVCISANTINGRGFHNSRVSRLRLFRGLVGFIRNRVKGTTRVEVLPELNSIINGILELKAPS
jgi:hypothetical protein